MVDGGCGVVKVRQLDYEFIERVLGPIRDIGREQARLQGARRDIPLYVPLPRE